ncbi:PQQ-like beta-propeller repeat protein [Natronolimnohabitans sp. A-GB9]|uniref:PQQ-binding-like beta-propeller repeat protein n=1 Tax=Natronolimnohabitans sp. A-GB9 TaxID=3069757 RepID=UPI0027B26FEF|nr:PQQ-binding-like beta-propeller repeat protein [Natronolimnohabitans sp. A-GB9]MDQ2049552.1 PQQ-like beta-propeller repeat protein [Natronolimnohabitans sp. A-GB9]
MSGNQTRTRRQWLGTCAGVAGTTALAGCFDSDTDENDGNENDVSGDPADASSSTDWPMYGVDLQNTGYQPNATGPSGDELTARKVHDIGGGSSYPVILADDRLYATSRDGVVLAFDRESEELLWKEDGHGPLMAHDGMIYGPRASHSVYGYDMEGGDRWESDEIELDSSLNLNNEPIPTPNGVFVISDNHVWNVDLDSGDYTSVRRYPRNSRDLIGTTDVPAYHDGILYHAMGVELYALNVETGDHEWTVKGENVLHIGNPTVFNGMVFVSGGDEQLHAYDAKSGEEVWTVETTTGVETSPAVADGIVYLGDNQRVIAVKAESGEIKWEIEKPLPESEVVIADDVVYLANSLGVIALDCNTGDLHWEMEFNGYFTSSPVISGETIYVPALDDKLYAIEGS